MSRDNERSASDRLLLLSRCISDGHFQVIHGSSCLVGIIVMSDLEVTLLFVWLEGRCERDNATRRYGDVHKAGRDDCDDVLDHNSKL